MYKRRTIKAALTAATIAVAVAVPVSAASAATASPQVHTVVVEGYFPNYDWCVAEGNSIILSQYSTGYECDLTSGGYLLLSYFD